MVNYSFKTGLIPALMSNDLWQMNKSDLVDMVSHGFILKIWVLLIILWPVVMFLRPLWIILISRLETTGLCSNSQKKYVLCLFLTRFLDLDGKHHEVKGRCKGEFRAWEKTTAVLGASGCTYTWLGIYAMVDVTDDRLLKVNLRLWPIRSYHVVPCRQDKHGKSGR